MKLNTVLSTKTMKLIFVLMRNVKDHFITHFQLVKNPRFLRQLFACKKNPAFATKVF